MRTPPTPFAAPKKSSGSRPNSLLWIFDPLERDASYARRKMFGCDAAYIDGLLCLVAADRAAPWNGLLVCTSREQQAGLLEEMAGLRPHPVLGKWLYVPEDDGDFEPIAQRIVALVLDRDPRIGVEPGRRSRGRKATKGVGS